MPTFSDKYFTIDSDDLNEALIPSHTYTSSATPWIIRNSFPTLQTLYINATDMSHHGLLIDPCFAVQVLAGLPKTLTEVCIPFFDVPVVDIFRLLPPYINKIPFVGISDGNCFPTSHHTLDNLEFLELCISGPHNDDYVEKTFAGRWAPNTSSLRLPSSLTHLGLFLQTYDLRFTLPSSLKTLAMQCGGRTAFSHPDELWKILTPSLTSLDCSGFWFVSLTSSDGSSGHSRDHSAEQSAGNLHSMGTPWLTHLKHFKLSCRSPSNLVDSGTGVWSQLIRSMPVVESFHLSASGSSGSLGLKSLELFNKSTLQNLVAELRLEEYGPIDQIQSQLRVILPNTTVVCSSLEKCLVDPYSMHSLELDRSHVAPDFDWSRVTPSNFPHLATLRLSPANTLKVNVESLTTLTDLRVQSTWSPANPPLYVVCPPNLTRLTLPPPCSTPFTVYPLPKTLTYLECTNPVPSEVQKCDSLTYLSVRGDHHVAQHNWSKEHFPASLTYVSLPARTWVMIAEESKSSTLYSLCQRLPRLRTIHVCDNDYGDVKHLCTGLPPHVLVSGVDLSILEKPSEVASLAGLSHGDVAIHPGETITECNNRWIGRKAYNIRPTQFSSDLLSEAEMRRFLPYLSPSNTELVLEELIPTTIPFAWPLSLTKLVILESVYDQQARFYLPETLRILIVQRDAEAPMLEPLPSGLTRLEAPSWFVDHAVQWPSSLRKLHISFQSSSLLVNLQAMPTSLTHLTLGDSSKRFAYESIVLGTYTEPFEALPPSLKCLECLVPESTESEFAEQAQPRNRLDHAKNGG